MKWLKGLLSATIGGAAGAVGVIVADPVTFNPMDGGLKKLGIVVGVTAITHAAMYLKQSPIPGGETKK